MSAGLRIAAFVGIGFLNPSCGASARLPESKPFGYVDAPAPGAHVQTSFLARGWALDDERTIKISATIDGTIQVPIPFRTGREDVGRVFPLYVSHVRNAGWMATLTVSTAGPHSLVVRYADSTGGIHDVGPIAFVVSAPTVPPVYVTAPSTHVDPANALPFGSVEDPPPGAHVGADTVVKGWVLDDRGVREIRVFVDRRYAKSIAPAGRSTTRQDWSDRLMLGALSTGAHTLLFQAVDVDGLTRVIGVVPVVVGQ